MMIECHGSLRAPAGLPCLPREKTATKGRVVGYPRTMCRLSLSPEGDPEP